MRGGAFLILFLALAMSVTVSSDARKVKRSRSPTVTQANENCVDVRIAGAVTTDFSCLNAGLKNKVAQSRRESQIDTTTSVKSSSSALGTFNIAAEKLKMGQNFGKSVVPYRPPPPVYRPVAGPPPPPPQQK